jgi:hypothetical protein
MVHGFGVSVTVVDFLVEQVALVGWRNGAFRSINNTGIKAGILGAVIGE